MSWVRLGAVIELLPAALDAQLRRDSGLTHFEYFCLAMLSEAPERTLCMSAPARLSHVVRKLEERGLVERFPCPEDARATNARLTPAGWDTVRASAPGHVATVRDHVIDALTPAQLAALGEAADAILATLDPEGTMTPLYHHYDSPA